MKREHTDDLFWLRLGVWTLGIERHGVERRGARHERNADERAMFFEAVLHLDSILVTLTSLRPLLDILDEGGGCSPAIFRRCGATGCSGLEQAVGDPASEAPAPRSLVIGESESRAVGRGGPVEDEPLVIYAPVGSVAVTGTGHRLAPRGAPGAGQVVEEPKPRPIRGGCILPDPADTIQEVVVSPEHEREQLLVVPVAGFGAVDWRRGLFGHARSLKRPVCRFALRFLTVPGERVEVSGELFRDTSDLCALLRSINGATGRRGCGVAMPTVHSSGRATFRFRPGRRRSASSAGRSVLVGSCGGA